MYFLLIAPCGKGTQESLGFWIPGSGFQSLSGKLGFWIPFVCGIPDSLSCLPDSKVEDFGFYLAGLNFPRSRIPKTKVSRILEFRIALHLARLTWRCLILFGGAHESWYYDEIPPRIFDIGDFTIGRRDGSENVASKMNLRPFGPWRDYSNSSTLSNVGEPSRRWISMNYIQV